jgi:hypothetical protein
MGANIIESCQLFGVIPAKVDVKKSNAAFAADQQPSFPRKRESISPYGTSGYMDPRMRGDDGLALNSPCQSLFADFFTRSQAGIHASKKRWSHICLPWVPAFAGTTPRLTGWCLQWRQPPDLG